MFGSLWTQEYTRHCLTITWKKQDVFPKVRDIVMFTNKPCYKHELTVARIQAFLPRRNGDVYSATIAYRRDAPSQLTVTSIICTRSWK